MNINFYELLLKENAENKKDIIMFQALTGINLFDFMELYKAGMIEIKNIESLRGMLNRIGLNNTINVLRTIVNDTNDILRDFKHDK
ncbi:MAG: hypothetical protein EHM20_00225 [Alphaproteobacteria bacterium]|nr:MAG: hypothetical protein EHM20_00225 [Alphaproteobacteria bacterium]